MPNLAIYLGAPMPNYQEIKDDLAQNFKNYKTTIGTTVDGTVRTTTYVPNYLRKNSGIVSAVVCDYVDGSSNMMTGGDYPIKRCKTNQSGQVISINFIDEKGQLCVVEDKNGNGKIDSGEAVCYVHKNNSVFGKPTYLF